MMKKKVIAIVIVVAMLLALLPVFSMAGETDEETLEGIVTEEVTLADGMPDEEQPQSEDNNSVVSGENGQDKTESVQEVQNTEQSVLNEPTQNSAAPEPKMVQSPVPAMLTAGNSVAKIGTVEYPTLAEAFSAAKSGDTVEILVDELDCIRNIPAGVTIQGKESKTTLTGNYSGDLGQISGSLEDITIKNIKFDGAGNAMRWCYAKGSQVVIENCEFDCDQQYGIHFDDLAADLLVKDCSIKGTVALSATTKKIQFDSCTFAGRSNESGHCNINLYSSASFTNCKFSDDYTNGSSRGILMPGNDNTIVTFDGCSLLNSESNYSLADVFRRDYLVIGKIDAQNDAVSGKYIAGTFVLADAKVESVKSNVADGYELVAVDGQEKAYIVKQKTPVAKIGNVQYYSFEDALNAAKANDVIELLSNVELSNKVNINKNNIIINGNGYTISPDNDTSWDKYKLGGTSQRYGSCNLLSVSGSNVTLKNMKIDIKDLRGVSCVTTTGGSNVTYDSINMTGRGSGHYYGYANNGLVTFKNCTIKTQGYGIHLANEGTKGDKVVIDDCKVYGWNSFGTCESVTVSDTYFGVANDEGKNGYLAVFRPYCDTTLTNCTFSKEYVMGGQEGYTYVGMGTGAAVNIILENCKVEDGTEIYKIVNYDDAFDNEAAAKDSVFIFDADEDNGFFAGTFVTKKDNFKITCAEGYELLAVEGQAYTYVVRPKLTVTLNYNNGSENKSYEVSYGSIVEEPSDPVRLGYKFEKWTDNETGYEFDFEQKITDDVVLNAVWSKEVTPGIGQPTTKVEENLTEEVKVTTETEKAAITNADIITQDIVSGNLPEGVSSDDAKEINDIIANAEKASDIEKILTLNAIVSELDEEEAEKIDEKLYDDEYVTYVFDLSVDLTVKDKASGDEYTVNVKSVDEPLEFVLNVDPEIIKGKAVRVVTIHNGVVKEANVKSIDFEKGLIYIIADEFSTYTVLVSEDATVTFESNGGSSVPAQTVAIGGLVSKPGDPARDGYRFDGWFKDSSLTAAWDFAKDKVENHTILYAKWLKIYTVSFNSNGGQSIASQKVIENNKAVKPSDPTMKGYTFAGWYKDAALITAFSFDTPITADTVLYAKWTANAFKTGDEMNLAVFMWIIVAAAGAIAVSCAVFNKNSGKHCKK